MVLVLSSLLFILVAALGMVVGVRFWIRPKAAVERVLDTAVPVSRTREPLISKVRGMLDAAGRRMNSREKDRERVAQQLAGAGFRKANVIDVYNGCRVVASVLLC